MDGVQQTEIECRENSANLDRKWATARQADCHSTAAAEFDSKATNLGVVLDGQLSMYQQMTAVCRSCFHQLHQLKSVKSSVTREALHFLIQASVHCRLDYTATLHCLETTPIVTMEH